MASNMHTSGPAYQARFGFTRRDLWMTPFMVAGATGSALVAVVDSPLTGAFGVLCVLYLLMRVAQVASRRVAFRVDVAGVTMSLSPPWPDRHTAFVPWRDITGIVLWRQQTGSITVPYVGLRRVEGAPQLPGSARGRLARLNLAATPADVPAQVVHESRQISGWRLDRQRLEAAVARFAPHVTVEDVG